MPAPGTPFRKTEPAVKPYAAGNRAKAQEVAEGPDNFQNDKFAASNQATRKARVQWWLHRAKSLDVEPFPLAVQTIDMAGAELSSYVLCSPEKGTCATGFGHQRRDPVVYLGHRGRQAMPCLGLEAVGRHEGGGARG